MFLKAFLEKSVLSEFWAVEGITKNLSHLAGPNSIQKSCRGGNCRRTRSRGGGCGRKRFSDVLGGAMRLKSCYKGGGVEKGGI